MPSYAVRARRYTTIPDEPLTRRLSWPPRRLIKPVCYDHNAELYERLTLMMGPDTPADDPGYDADEEDNVARNPFMASLRERRRRMTRTPTPPTPPPPEKGSWRSRSFIYGE